MSCEWLVPQCGILCIRDELWFQQDGATPHHALVFRKYLNEIFLEAAR
jgi:hypothetical protein